MSKIKMSAVLLLVSVTAIFLMGAGPGGTDETQIMVYYYGQKVPMAQLTAKVESLSCDDHLGAGVLTCYNSFEELLKANNCQLGKEGSVACAANNYGVSPSSRGGDSASSPTSYCPYNTLYATVFEHINYGGQNRAFYYDYNDFRSIGFNDMASSIRVTTSCAATLYQDINYGGTSKYFNANHPDFTQISFNDKASSITKSP